MNLKKNKTYLVKGKKVKLLTWGKLFASVKAEGSKFDVKLIELEEEK